MEGMKNQSASWKCILLCVVAPIVTARVPERAKAVGIIETLNPVASASPFLFPGSSLPPSAIDRQQQVHVWEHPQRNQQQKTQTDAMPGFYSEKVASSCGAPASFAQLSLNADEDVSCFPHDQNIGSRAHTVTLHYTDNVLDCLRECRKMATCTHFTYNRRSRGCHLKEAAPDFYEYKDDMTGPRSCDSTCFVSCLTYNTNPIQTLRQTLTTPTLCQAACAATEDCQAFVWTEGECKLFGSGFAPHRTVMKGKSVAGPRYLCEVGSDLRFREAHNGNYLGTCLLSDDVGSTVAEVNKSKASNTLACQQLCASNSLCDHYTFNTSSKVCFLKSGHPDYYRYPNDVTGVKNCIPT